MSVEDLAAFTDARIAALKAGLELTPDQAKNWPAFEQALRETAQLHIQQMQAREAGPQQAADASRHAVRSAAQRADNMSQDERRAQAHRRRRRAALSKPQRRAEGTASGNCRACCSRITITCTRVTSQCRHGWRQGYGYGRDGGNGGQFGTTMLTGLARRSIHGGHDEAQMDTDDQGSQL